MIQEIKPKTFHNQYRNVTSENEDLILVFQERSILIREGSEEILFPTIGEVKQASKDQNLDEFTVYYLFSIDETRYYLGLYHGAGSFLLSGYAYEPMYGMRRRGPKDQVMAAATGWHLNVWYEANQFCGRCGERTVHDEKERMLRCPHCNQLIFPKIAPAVIVGVTYGDRILLTTYANREYKRFALIAGFNEIGETIEETVGREVMEEVGLRVKNIRYYKSQPWGFDSNLLMGFFAEVDTKDGDIKITMDENELATAEWVKAEDVPEYPEHLSLTHEMMTVFKNGKIS